MMGRAAPDGAGTDVTAGISPAGLNGRDSGGRDGSGRDRSARLGALLARAQDGDREQLREIVAELTPLLWRVARGQGLAHDDAEDVVQTVWLSLVARLAQIRTPAALIAWLVTATKRESWRLRGVLERTRVIGVEELAEVVDPGVPAEDLIIANERLRFVREAMERLTPRCAELLRMLAVADRPDYDAVAQSLGMPRGSVGPSRGRCLAKLRAILLADTRWSAQCP